MPPPILPKRPALGPNPNYSHVIYPDPPSHDFLVFLIMAELNRRYFNCTESLKVRFGLFDGMLGKFDFNIWGLAAGRAYHCGVSREYYELMLKGVLRPAIQLINAVEQPPIHLDNFGGENIADYVEYDYHIYQLVDAARAGHKVPKWIVPDYHFHFDPPITITLRESTQQPERNSNILEWLKFAASIQQKYNVLFVRDTGKFGSPLDDSTVTTFARASVDAEARVALYNYALLNLFVGNGPVGWAMFSNANYLQFKQLVPALPDWEHGSPKGWREQAHLEVGESWPWASPTQRLTWKDDTFENISYEFHQMMEIINC